MRTHPSIILTHPDELGSSEYRAVYEFVETLYDSGLTNSEIVDSLVEMKSCVGHIQARYRKNMKGVKV